MPVLSQQRNGHQAARLGLTFSKLNRRSRGHHPAILRAVLKEELAAGRITRDQQGHYSIRPGAFPPATVRALAALDNGRIRGQEGGGP